MSEITRHAIRECTMFNRNRPRATGWYAILDGRMEERTVATAAYWNGREWSGSSKAVGWFPVAFHSEDHALQFAEENLR